MLEIKDLQKILTRSKNCKIIFVGENKQISNKLIDKYNNTKKN